MGKIIYNIVRTAEGSMTTYRVADVERADNDAICQALTAAAKDAWEYLTTVPGSYTATEVANIKYPIDLREGTTLPKEMTEVQVVCGTFRCGVGLKDDRGCDNYSELFRVLSKFESMTHLAQKERSIFTARMELGKLVCEARVVLPTDMKAICDCCGDNVIYPSTMCPAIDLDRRCIVATDGKLLVARKFNLVSIHHEGEMPKTFYMPKEVVRMQGEVTVQLYERGCTVIDEKGVEVSVEHTYRYPRWETVWPAYRSGMAAVDGKAMTKAVKGAVGTLPERGKGDKETVLLTHEPKSKDLCISAYHGAEKKSGQSMSDVTASDVVAWRLPMNAGRLLKALALKPKAMYAGYNEQPEQPNRLVLEDAESGMAAVLYLYSTEDLEKALHETEADFAVNGPRALHRCFDKDSWLLDSQKAQSTPTIQSIQKTQITQTTQKPSFVDMLRKVLMAA